MNKLFFASVAFAVLSLSSAGQKFIPADDPDILIMGRTQVTPDHTIQFNYPGVTTMFNFSGTSLLMLAKPGSGYYMVEIDTLPKYKVFFSPNDSVISLAQKLPEGNHAARITYAVEGYEMKPEIRGFILDAMGKLLDKPTVKGPKLEFIGNSITCGYGTEADSAQAHFSYATENHCLSFAHLTARNLDAEYNVVSRSGIGVYRNFNGPKEGSQEQTMPMEYDKTMLYSTGLPWDFTSFTPDIICINLGTNDFSTNNYDASLYASAYSAFLDHVLNVNPTSKIVLLTGSMLDGKELETQKAILDTIAGARDRVSRFDMTPQSGDLGYGADYHPSAAQSEVMAAELTDYLNKLLAKTPLRRLP